jgi:hypothetical protein
MLYLLWAKIGLVQSRSEHPALFLCGGAARFCAAFLALRIADQPLGRVVSLPEPPRRAKLAA